VPFIRNGGRIFVPVTFHTAQSTEAACNVAALGSRENEKLRKVLLAYEVVTVRMVTLALMKIAGVDLVLFERLVAVLLYSVRVILRKLRGGGMLTTVSDDSADQPLTIPA